jgi:hypothetical protein
MSARPSVVSLSKTQDQRYMVQMTKDAYCPVPPPAWLNLLGWCTAAVVFGALAVIAHNKKVGAGAGWSRQMAGAALARTLLCSFLCFAPCSPPPSLHVVDALDAALMVAALRCSAAFCWFQCCAVRRCHSEGRADVLQQHVAA